MKSAIHPLATLPILGLSLLLSGCQYPTEQTKRASSSPSLRDFHSYSNPDRVKVKHVLLNLDVLFDSKTLKGFAVLEVERTVPGNEPLVLDTKDLNIERVETAKAGEAFSTTGFQMGSRDAILGTPLSVQIPPKTTRVRVHYATSHQAEALQWLTPPQTTGKKYPFLYSQSEPIYARSWIPLQDTPAVRVTYTAILRTPKDLVAVMSAENDPDTPRNGEFRFKMTQPIPSYLIALAVGDLTFRSLGPRTGVFAEPEVVDKAAAEFADTERMLAAAEQLYGPYRWGRYDILVLPPSFPYGGMENPRLTFATPTVLAGDKSLVALIAHELAHSWSGNLVTNATWDDFWLNEGFTTYVQARIIEAVYGEERARLEAVLEWQEREEALKTLPLADQLLHIDLKGRNPEEGTTDIPYNKGAAFLRHLEVAYGRKNFDGFLLDYFDHHAFQSLSTSDFVSYLQDNLVRKNADASKKVTIDAWIYQPGLPAEAVRPQSETLARVESQAHLWLKSDIPTSRLMSSSWGHQEWLRFLRALPADLSAERMRELDQTFHLTRSGNAEILDQWLLMSIRAHYKPADRKLEEFLIEVGRRKFTRPLYLELAKTPSGLERAVAIYRKARPGYHPIAVATIDQILGWKTLS